MKEWAEKFYKGKRWQQCRNAYYIFKYGICERCGNAGSIVHHKIYITPKNINDPDITLSFDNLELLCEDCHKKEHSKQLPISDEIIFDDMGNVRNKNNYNPPI